MFFNCGSLGLAAFTMRIPSNMSGMLDRVGLDAVMFAPTDLGFAVDTCQSCDADQVCLNWLVRAPEWLDKAPAFCHNAERFARMREMTIALTTPAPAVDLFIHKIWPPALIACGLGFSAAWACLLGYGLVRLIALVL